ncbi:MAG: hypothetical protein KC449_31000, partial [Anaerolineales bacterium]|nr:hypothetical protein [Anaerolineales bacterium]
ILPLTFVHEADYGRIVEGDTLVLPDIRQALRSGRPIQLINQSRHETYLTEHQLSDRQIEIVLVGGQINLFRQQHAVAQGAK